MTRFRFQCHATSTAQVLAQLLAQFLGLFFVIGPAHGQTSFPISKQVDLTTDAVVFETTVDIPWEWAPNYELALTAEYEQQGRLTRELRDLPAPPFLPIALWGVLGVPDDARTAIDPRVGWMFPQILTGERIGLTVTVSLVGPTSKPIRFSAPVPGNGTQPVWKYNQLRTPDPLYINVDLSRFGPVGDVSSEIQHKDFLRLHGLERGGRYLVKVRNVARIRANPGVRTSIVLRQSPWRL